MSRFLKIEGLEDRRRVLARESDLYREVLKLRIRNLQLYGAQAQRRLSSFGPSNPLLRLVGPLLGPLIVSFMRRRAPVSPNMMAKALVAWKILRKGGSLLSRVMGRRRRKIAGVWSRGWG